jgi:hypothetical protein
LSQELIYTSAPRGLKLGSQGFCTVACTQGMSAALMERLESLSGYRHVYGPQDPRASQNPIAFSHLHLAVAGRQVHVLSRIAAFGLNYTRRSNKLAHHVVLEPGELPRGGPAWLLACPNFTRRVWDHPPGFLAAFPAVPAGDSPAAVCRLWQEATGDAGWGGVLAESALGGAGRLVYLVFPPGRELLPLFQESLALLPEGLRWRVTFNTYFTKLPAGIDCQWRGVLAGSIEVREAARLPQALVLDVCRPLGQAVGGACVAIARTGAAAPLTPRPLLSATRAAVHVREAEEYALAPLAGIWDPTQLPPAVAIKRPKRKPSAQWPWLLAGSTLVLVLLGIALYLCCRPPAPGAPAVSGTQAGPAGSGSGDKTQGGKIVTSHSSDRK